MEQKAKRCCFTGHRPDKMQGMEQQIKTLLKTEIKKCIDEGILTFISGMAMGVDIWAAQIVLEEKKNNDDIKLICASPYPGSSSIILLLFQPSLPLGSKLTA